MPTPKKQSEILGNMYNLSGAPACPTCPMCHGTYWVHVKSFNDGEVQRACQGCGFIATFLVEVPKG